MMPWISSQLSPNCAPTAFWLAALSQAMARDSNSAVKLTVFHVDWMNIPPGGVALRVFHRGDAQGGFQRSGLNPLLWGEPPVLGGVGGNPPAPAFPRRGKRERGRFKFLAAAG